MKWEAVDYPSPPSVADASSLYGEAKSIWMNNGFPWIGQLKLWMLSPPTRSQCRYLKSSLPTLDRVLLTDYTMQAALDTARAGKLAAVKVLVGMCSVKMGLVAGHFHCGRLSHCARLASLGCHSELG